VGSHRCIITAVTPPAPDLSESRASGFTCERILGIATRRAIIVGICSPTGVAGDRQLFPSFVSAKTSCRTSEPSHEGKFRAETAPRILIERLWDDRQTASFPSSSRRYASRISAINSATTWPTDHAREAE